MLLLINCRYERKKDIRWLQRFDNYRKALFRLKQAVKIVSDNIEADEYDEIDEF